MGKRNKVLRESIVSKKKTKKNNKQTNKLLWGDKKIGRRWKSRFIFF